MIAVCASLAMLLAATPAAADEKSAADPGPQCVEGQAEVDPGELEEMLPPPEPRISQEELRARFVPFPGALTDLIPMGDKTIAYGVPMAISYFETRAEAPEILTFYAQHFSARGWSRFGMKDTQRWIEHPAITATDPNDLTQMSVMVVEGGTGQGETNTVVVSIADARPQARIPEDGQLPDYPGAAPFRIRSTEAGVASSTFAFITEDPPQAVAEFYLRRMADLGYEQVKQESEDKDATSLAFATQSRLWQIRISKQTQATLVTAISMTREPEAP